MTSRLRLRHLQIQVEKLIGHPRRFIEWVGCCCSGSYIDKNIKLENVEEGVERKQMGSICRDEHNKHHIRTLACEALSHFPLFMPLYPGIHGEVVMSKSPKWLVNSGPGSKKDIFSTRVLVPVSDGLVELFSFTMKPVDESMVDLIISRCNTFFEPFPEQTMQLRIIPRAEESMSSGVNLSFEGGSGSSSVSNPSSETTNKELRASDDSSDLGGTTNNGYYTSQDFTSHESESRAFNPTSHRT